MIPKNIIQFWHNKDSLPDVLSQAMAVTKESNSDYTIIFADDNFMFELISEKYNQALLSLYQMNRIPACRADMSRLILLYEYGGFYLDASMELHKSLNKYHDQIYDVILVQRDDVERHKKNPEKAHVINGIIAAPAKSPFIKWCIQRVIRNLVTGENNKKVNISTGPNVVNQAVVEFENSLNIKKLSFKILLDDLLYYRRVSGFSNSWTVSQRDGIINNKFYDKYLYHREKLWMFENTICHLSFSFLSVKNNDTSPVFYFYHKIKNLLKKI